MYNREKEEEYEKAFLIKKKKEMNSWETQGKPTRVANTNTERGDQLTKISSHNKYDGARILGHIQSDPPKTDFPYSLACLHDR